jgi:CPA1 family monovalent cation:H+ antiporter
MGLFQLVASLVVLAAILACVNDRFIRLPASIGVMALAMLFSLALVGVGALEPAVRHEATRAAGQIHFNEALLQWMLGFLLFAGALSVDVEEFIHQSWAIALLATAGTVISMFLVGGATYGALRLTGLKLPLIDCLTFGALISPTDPIAVIAICKSIGAPRGILTKIAGESLFNDGIAVVLFVTMLAIAGGATPTAGAVAKLLGLQVLGGIILGVAAGFIGYWAIHITEHLQVQLLITLAIVMGPYALADALHLSGPLAVVVAGVFIGNRSDLGRFRLRPEVGRNLDTFWELIEELLNSVLFLLLGLAVLALPFSRRHALAALLSVPVVLAARLISVSAILAPLSRWRRLARYTIPILTWGGLRGGLAVAMALSLPASPRRNAILAMTYGVVVFSILVQGTSMRWLVTRLLGKPEGRAQMYQIAAADKGAG